MDTYDGDNETVSPYDGMSHHMTHDYETFSGV